jgi:prepilin-type N-terminal cleavage/methylation domain-containing protein
MKSPKRTGQAGYSLIELLVALGILGALTGSALLATRGGIGSFESARSAEATQAKLHRSANRILREVMSAGIDVVGPAALNSDQGSSTLSFQVPISLDENGLVWGPTQTMEFEYEPGEINDGIDNDNDGLIDEGQVVLTRDSGLASAQRVVLCTGVRETFPGEVVGNLNDDNGNGIEDEGGFNVSLDGSVLTLRLCVELPSFQGTTVVRQLTTSTRMRN